jgi:hypothetical protein
LHAVHCVQVFYVVYYYVICHIDIAFLCTTIHDHSLIHAVHKQAALGGLLSYGQDEEMQHGRYTASSAYQYSGVIACVLHLRVRQAATALQDIAYLPCSGSCSVELRCGRPAACSKVIG